MDDAVPRRPWWKKKRTWAAVVVWLAVAYPLGYGATWYGIGRHWLPREAAVSPAWEPINRAWNFADAEAWDHDSPWWVRLPSAAVRRYGEWAVGCGRVGEAHRRRAAED